MANWKQLGLKLAHILFGIAARRKAAHLASPKCLLLVQSTQPDCLVMTLSLVCLVTGGTYSKPKILQAPARWPAAVSCSSKRLRKGRASIPAGCLRQTAGAGGLSGQKRNVTCGEAKKDATAACVDVCDGMCVRVCVCVCDGMCVRVRVCVCARAPVRARMCKYLL